MTKSKQIEGTNNFLIIITLIIIKIKMEMKVKLSNY